MTQLDFPSLLKTLDEANSPKEQIALIKTAAAKNTFTCDQVIQLFEKLSFVKEQLRVLEILRSRIDDIGNSFQIVEAFRFSKYQKKARFILKQPEDVEATLAASSETETELPALMKPAPFLNLLDALSEQKFPKEQFYLVELAAYRNSFTSEQVMLIIEKFKFPRHQLKALKILRYRITDPENQFVILTALDYSSDKKKASQLLAIPNTLSPTTPIMTPTL
ncbi:MAG: hypothetical protein DRR16_25720 [Candidatus Parabeggiatoa sp. nov. 3]|jgi:hypothetical protein|nr:MAG: hypothetical protein DRR00_04300 [Gammaproteobacteria bacterium]RKZ67358.1 MAG: hypothetical protein DRQ99_06985 [Gammaproteobacteria bacterium]RKZ79430.1 MAG: hypothetical protein DRR16_25720 [Gammaproteobacteria bacterium]